MIPIYNSNMKYFVMSLLVLAIVASIGFIYLIRPARMNASPSYIEPGPSYPAPSSLPLSAPEQSDNETGITQTAGQTENASQSILGQSQTSDQWQEFSSQYGYTIQYPTDWSYTDCGDGTQIDFVPWPGAVSTCQGIDGFGPLMITGPLSSDDLSNDLGTPGTVMIKTFSLNGLAAIQYSFPVYPDQTMLEDVVTMKSGTFSLLYPADDATNTPVIDRMLGSFSVTNIASTTTDSTSGLPTH